MDSQYAIDSNGIYLQQWGYVMGIHLEISPECTGYQYPIGIYLIRDKKIIKMLMWVNNHKS